MSQDENENTEIILSYNGKEEKIDIPEDYDDLLNDFMEKFYEDRNKDFKFYYFDKNNQFHLLFPIPNHS
jgi:hypothetical protein